MQKDTVQNGRSAEMGNVYIILSSRVTEWHDVTSRNNQLNKQLKDITYVVQCIENTLLFRSYYCYELIGFFSRKCHPQILFIVILHHCTTR